MFLTIRYTSPLRFSKLPLEQLPNAEMDPIALARAGEELVHIMAVLASGYNEFMEKILEQVNTTLEQTKAKKAMSLRSKIALGVLGLFIFFIILAVRQGGKTPAQTYSAPAIARDSVAYKASLPQYTVAFHINGDGYKKASYYYVSIVSPKLADAKFKEDIKAITKELLAIHDDKIIIQFSDSTDTLQNLYHEQLFPEMAPAEDNSQPKHLIASYTGNLDIPTYANTLVFFPAAFTNTPQVGSYKETINFQ